MPARGPGAEEHSSVVPVPSFRGPSALNAPESTLLSGRISEAAAALAFDRTFSLEPPGPAAAVGERRARRDGGLEAYLGALNLGVTAEHAGRYAVAGGAASGELGRGGLGRVFVALDRHLGREVAIKELLPDVMESADAAPALQAVSRFLREARVTGRLDHPNIVPVYELGRRADGSLYYTMRVVRGRTLSRAIAEASALEQRLVLVNHFSGLCQAIAYAHSRGVVHRDIKPDNVMIGEFGETVVLDWGMAKLQGTDAADDLLEAHSARAIQDPESLELTLDGTLCGTPIYMSPEQAEGRVKEVDERSDVWSLGVVLYTILVGRPPFSGKTFPKILEQVKSGAFTPPRAIDPRIPPELAAVVERALQRDKLDRYGSARDLARDVQAYQAGARVGAYDYSAFELVSRFVARYRGAVIASAIGLVSVLALGITAYFRVLAAKDRAVAAEGRALHNERAAKQSERSARHSLAEMLVEKAEQALGDADPISAELFAARALDVEERADARGIVLASESAARPEPALSLPAARGCARTAFAFQGGLFACGRGRALELWNAREREKLWSVELGSDVAALALGGGSSGLVVALADGTLRLVRPADGSVELERRVAEPSAVAIAPDGAELACGTARGLIFGFRRDGGAAGRFQINQPVSALSYARSGGALAVAGELGALSVFATRGPERRDFEGHTGTVRALAFAQDGRYLASAGADRSVRFWAMDEGQRPVAPIAHRDAVTSLAWSENGGFVAFGGKDKSFRLRDLRSGGAGTLVRLHDDAVELMALSADEGELATFSKDVGLRLWSLASFGKPHELSERGNVLAVAFVPGQELLLGAGLGQNGVCLWSLANGSCSTRLPARLDRVRALAVSDDGKRLALAGSGRQVMLWDLAQRIPSHVLEGQRDEARAVAFSPDGAWLAAAGLDRAIRVYDAERGSPIAELSASAALQALAFSGRSSALFSGDRDGHVERWDVKAGRRAERWKAHDDWVLALSASRDGRFLASAGGDRKVRIWDTATRALLHDLVGHEGKVLSVEFAADGALVASAGEDKSVRVWDARSGRELARFPAHEGAVRAVRFARSGRVLASGSDDGTIRLWRLDDLASSGAAIAARVERKFQVELVGSRVIARR